MSETLPNSEQEPRMVPPPESGEFLDSLEQQGHDREMRKPRLNDVGVDKAAQELFAKVRAEHAMDSESGMHTDAGIQLPAHARDEKHKAELIEKLIDTASGDPFDEIEMLGK